jgi:hypothetical protein
MGTVLCTQLTGDWVGPRAVLDVAEERKSASTAGTQTSVVHTLNSQRTCVINIGIPNCGTCPRVPVEQGVHFCLQIIHFQFTLLSVLYKIKKWHV